MGQFDETTAFYHVPAKQRREDYIKTASPKPPCTSFELETRTRWMV
jgi:hypothetical protein